MLENVRWSETNVSTLNRRVANVVPLVTGPPPQLPHLLLSGLVPASPWIPKTRVVDDISVKELPIYILYVVNIYIYTYTHVVLSSL